MQNKTDISNSDSNSDTYWFWFEDNMYFVHIGSFVYNKIFKDEGI